jgi:hypothetical protein
VRRIAAAESLAGLAGLAFVAIGVAGFVPGAVQHYGDLHWWRTGSGAELFGLFRTSVMLNLLHAGFGVLGLVAARTEAGARAYLGAGGVLCFALGIHGLLIDRLGDANVVPLDRDGVWLHVGLGLALVYLGLATRLAAARAAAAP